MRNLEMSANRRTDAKATEYISDDEDSALEMVARLKVRGVRARYFAPVSSWPEHLVMIDRRGVAENPTGWVAKTEYIRIKEIIERAAEQAESNY